MSKFKSAGYVTKYKKEKTQEDNKSKNKRKCNTEKK